VVADLLSELVVAGPFQDGALLFGDYSLGSKVSGLLLPPHVSCEVGPKVRLNELSGVMPEITAYGADFFDAKKLVVVRAYVHRVAFCNSLAPGSLRVYIGPGIEKWYQEGVLYLGMSNINDPPSQHTNDAKWTWMEPIIRCPKCGSVVNGLRGAEEAVPLPKPKNAPKFNQLPIVPPAWAEVAKPVEMVYRVAECGCKVASAWASAYAHEVHRRATGEAAREVTEVQASQSLVERTAAIAEIAKLANVCEDLKKDMGQSQGASVVNAAIARQAAEIKLVTKVHEFLKRWPDDANKLAPLNLSATAQLWAAKHGKTLPSGKPVTPVAKPPDPWPTKFGQSKAAEMFKQMLASSKQMLMGSFAADAADAAALGYAVPPVNPSKLVPKPPKNKTAGAAQPYHPNPSPGPTLPADGPWVSVDPQSLTVGGDTVITKTPAAPKPGDVVALKNTPGTFVVLSVQAQNGTVTVVPSSVTATPDPKWSSDELSQLPMPADNITIDYTIAGIDPASPPETTPKEGPLPTPQLPGKQELKRRARRVRRRLSKLKRDEDVD